MKNAADGNRPSMLAGTRPGTVLVPQGLLTRGPAFLLDTLLVSMMVGPLVGKQATLPQLVGITLVANFFYFSLSEWLMGATLGKRLVGLRVVRAADGRPCGPLAAVVRTLLRLVDNLLFSLPGVTAIVWSPRRQRLGDRVARTLVVSEVPLQLLAGFGAAASAAGASPDEMLRQIHEQLQRQSGVAGEATHPANAAAPGDLDECPFCDEPMRPDEIVCPQCEHYVNQVSADDEAESLAPVPALYSPDRRYRFDALWRLVFAADEASLAAVRDALPGWSAADRLLAVRAFSQVDDSRPLSFLAFMVDDPDPGVRSLARSVRERRPTS